MKTFDATEIKIENESDFLPIFKKLVEERWFTVEKQVSIKLNFETYCLFSEFIRTEWRPFRWSMGDYTCFLTL